MNYPRILLGAACTCLGLCATQPAVAHTGPVAPASTFVSNWQELA